MNHPEQNFATRVEAVIEAYGACAEAGMPSRDMWARLGEIAPDQPVTLVNFFKMRDRAAYPAGFSEDDTDVNGSTAFNRYAAVSMPTLENVGGRFLVVAPFGGTFIGETEDWDLVAVGTYPRPSAIVSLFEAPEYERAYVHRKAACASQRVSLLIG